MLEWGGEKIIELMSNAGDHLWNAGVGSMYSLGRQWQSAAFRRSYRRLAHRFVVSGHRPKYAYAHRDDCLVSANRNLDAFPHPGCIGLCGGTSRPWSATVFGRFFGSANLAIGPKRK